MTRYAYCGDGASLVVTRSSVGVNNTVGDPITGVLFVAGGESITAWNAHTAGAQYTSLASDAGATETFDHVVVDDGSGIWGKGVIPMFWGPDGVTGLWLSSNAGATRFFYPTSTIGASVDLARAALAPDLAAAATAAASVGFNAKTVYGAAGDGTTDDTARIQAAIDACSAAGGGEVFLPPGSYALKSATLLISNNVRLRGAGPGATTLLQAYWPNPAGDSSSPNAAALIEAKGTISTSPLTCGAVTPGALTITGISSTTTLSVGQWLLLASSDAYWPTGYPTRFKGELVRVASIDSGTAISITGVVRDAYSTSPTIRAMAMVTNVGLADLTIRNTEPGTTHATAMLRFTACKGVRIRNVELIGSDFAGIRLTNCYDAEVDDCSLYDFTDVPDTSQLGYGVLAEVATELLTVSNSRFTKVRHAFTTGGYTPSPGGAPHNVVISNNIATGTTETAFDTHQCGSGITFVGNSAIGCRNAGFGTRSPDTRFIGNTVSYCKTGFVVWGLSGGIGDGCQIVSNVVRHVFGDFGIRVYDADNVLIMGNSIDGTRSAGVYVGDDATRLNIINNRFSNTGIGGGSAPSGIEIVAGVTGTGYRIEGNRFYSGAATVNDPGSGPGAMPYAIRNQSTGVTGGWIVNNTSVGMGTDIISDVGGNTAYNNLQLDHLVVPAAPLHVVVTTANVVAVAGDVILANTATGGITVTLPAPAAGGAQALIRVMKVSSDGLLVTIVPPAGKTINGLTTATIDTQWTGVQILTDGTNYIAL